jgi:hypothetical protein
MSKEKSMDKVFTHSGATGDMVFSLPTIRAMGGGKLVITNFHKQRAESIMKLIEIQPYINGVEWSEDKPFGTYDLDKFRQYASHHNNLVEAHMNGQAIPIDKSWQDGWLTLPENVNIINGVRYSIINRTTNYADPNCDWSKEVEYLQSISDVVYFIGYPEEYLIFQDKFHTEAKYFPCDFLEGAYLLKKAVMFTGCYSAWSTIAMGLGINYRLEQAPNHTCSSLLQPRETIINV